MMVAHGKAFCIISRKISSQFSEHIGTCLYFSHHTSMIRVSFGKLTCLTPDNCKSSFIGVWSVEDSQMCIKWTSSPEKSRKKLRLKWKKKSKLIKSEHMWVWFSVDKQPCLGVG